MIFTSFFEKLKFTLFNDRLYKAKTMRILLFQKSGTKQAIWIFLSIPLATLWRIPVIFALIICYFIRLKLLLFFFTGGSIHMLHILGSRPWLKFIRLYVEFQAKWMYSSHKYEGLISNLLDYFFLTIVSFSLAGFELKS